MAEYVEATPTGTHPRDENYIPISTLSINQPSQQCKIFSQTSFNYSDTDIKEPI